MGLKLPVNSGDIAVVEERWESPVACGDVLPADKRRYVRSKLPVEKLIEAFRKAELVEL